MVWPNRHITFIVAKKLNLQFCFALFPVYVGEGVGWKCHMGGRGLKLLNKRHMIFECSLVQLKLS